MAAKRAISPAWFIPISMAAARCSARSRNRDSGKPISLLKLPSVFNTGPSGRSAAANSSLVLVLPTEPVTPTTLGEKVLR